MAEIVSKRQLSEVADTPEAAAKRQESSKASNKPGRKPLDTEPKNKRTAQNRAAQRAFRERKERKMKELEEKINQLEDEKKSANTESEFLRLQVKMLMGELAKHRGSSDFSDLNLPNLSKGSNSSTPTTNSSIDSPNDSTLKSLGNIMDPTHKNKSNQFSFEFPWSRKNSSSTANTSPQFQSNSSSNNIPSLQSDVSTNSSCDSSPFDLYNNDEQQELPLFNKVKDTRNLHKNPNEQEFEFNEHFDEGISDFCNDLSSACGTKDCPVPRSKSQVSTPMESSKGLPSNVINTDPLAFLNDGSLATFDASLAFDDHFNELFDENKNDPLNGLVQEESIYDPFSSFKLPTTPQVSKIDTPAVENVINESITAHESVQSKVQDESTGADDENDVIPAREGRLLKCTEIWDRITSHPKYSEIDIDGLCSELRSKAKCSDKGVVVDHSDVNKIINANLLSKGQRME